MPDTPVSGPVVLFDGVCNLCNGFVQFLIRVDEKGVLRFAPLQSDPGQELLEAHGRETGDFDSVVLVDGGGCYEKSDAALRIADHLDFPYSLAALFRPVPRGVRDGIYDLVAEYRYDIFGKRDQCMRPTEDVQSRFLAMDDAPPVED